MNREASAVKTAFLFKLGIVTLIIAEKTTVYRHPQLVGREPNIRLKGKNMKNQKRFHTLETWCYCKNWKALIFDAQITLLTSIVPQLYNTRNKIDALMPTQLKSIVRYTRPPQVAAVLQLGLICGVEGVFYERTAIFWMRIPSVLNYYHDHAYHDGAWKTYRVRKHNQPR